MTKVWIDADSIVYDAAFAVQKGDELEPVENALYLIKTQIHNILSGTNAKNFEIILSPVEKERNFRYSLNKFHSYKANRANKPKPMYYSQCREYLIDTWKAIVADGHEADDEVAIRHMEHYHEDHKDENVSCIACIDKDLNNIPGPHYNYRKHEHYFVGTEQAIKNFYLQLLVGDVADNVPGLKGIGSVTANKMLSSLYTEKDLFSEVHYQYMLKHPEDYKDRLLEAGKLLWIKRTREDDWEFPL